MRLVILLTKTCILILNINQTQLVGINYTNLSLYNPDNSNEPCSVNKNIITSLPNSKQQYFNADNNNIHLKMKGILTRHLY